MDSLFKKPVFDKTTCCWMRFTVAGRLQIYRSKAKKYKLVKLGPILCNISIFCAQKWNRTAASNGTFALHRFIIYELVDVRNYCNIALCVCAMRYNKCTLCKLVPSGVQFANATNGPLISSIAMCI